MLTEKELEGKLRGYAAEFEQNVRKKNWGRAHNIYHAALTAAVTAEMSEGFKKELFGYCGDDEEETEGAVDAALFRPSAVQRVNMECCVRRNMAYEDMACRRLGAAPGSVRYYSEEDYCALCRKRNTKK